MNSIIENKKIKVLFFIEQLSVSYKFFENLFKELNRFGNIDIEVLNLYRDEKVNTHLSQFCNKVYSLPGSKPYKKQVFNIIKIINRSKPDIIHAQEVIPAFYAALGLWAMVSAIPLIFHRHHSFYRNKATNFMEKIAFIKCALVISVSKTAQQQAFSEHPWSKKKITQLYNGITLNDNGMPLPLNIKDFVNHFKIVLLARLGSRKGHETAINAMDIVRKKIPYAVLFFAGEGNKRKEIEKWIAEKKLQQNVILLGDVQNIYALMNNIDISILPSESEAFNLSILETFAANKLSIASNLPSIKESIIDGETGVLVEVGNSEQLAEKIIYYIENQEEAARIAKKGFELYQKEFTADIMAKKIIAIYKQLIWKK